MRNDIFNISSGTDTVNDLGGASGSPESDVIVISSTGILNATVFQFQATNDSKNNATDAQKFCLNEAILFSLKMLFPISPHICEYLWSSFVNDESCIESSWPKYDEAIIESDEFELIIQVNGKVRGKLNISKNLDEDTVYFIINTLNQLNVDLIRNKLLLKVLPLKV